MATTIKISVYFGSDPSVATIWRSNSSTPIVADILGVDTDSSGKPNRLYLRSKIHGARDAECSYQGWEPSGAVSTILTRIDEVLGG